MENEIWQLIDSRDMGGIETHVLNLCRGLTKAGANPRVVFLRNYGPHPLQQRLAQLAIPFDVLYRPGELLRRARQDRPMILHTHGYKAGILGRLAGPIAMAPVVSTFHNGDKGSGKLRLYTLLDRVTGPLGHQIAVSNEISGRLFGRAALIENFVPLPPSVRGICEQRVIAFAGRLSKEKGPDLFCRLAETLSGIECHIYGDGPMYSELEKHYGHTVRFQGKVNGLEQHWPNIDLLCMTSRAEGLPMVALEAMASQVPVAALKVGGLGRLIDHGRTGWLAPPTDLDSLRSHILAHFGAPPDFRHEMGRLARATIVERYSMSSQVAKVMGVYENALRA